MSIEMAEQIDFDHPGLQHVANAVRENASGHGEDISSGTAQKRKRETSDQDGSADPTRRTSFKRVSPNSANTAGNGNESSGPLGSSVMDHQQDSAAVEALQEYNSGVQNGADHANASSTAAAALGIYPTMTIPQPTDVSFATQASEADRNDVSFNMGDNSQQDDSFNMHSSTGGAQSSGGRGSGTGSKPAVGSEEWHKVRKDNHKEVERRRRETINEGINELSKIVPGCEKNKGSILQRAVSFITQLKENEAQNIEKWTLEKLLTEQAIAELSASNDKLKAECERAWREVETWKKTCQSAGLAPKKEDLASAGAGGDN